MGDDGGAAGPACRQSWSGRIPAVLAGVLAAGAVCAAASAPASGAEEQPDEETPFGEAIEPGASLVEGTVVDSGTYVLPVPEADRAHYFEIERSEPGEVIWYGVTALLDTTTDDATIAVTGTADGVASAECNGPAGRPLQAGTFVTSLHGGNRTPECREAESITLEVSNAALFGDPLPAGVGSYQLTVWTEPPVTETDTLPTPSETSRFRELDFSDQEPEQVAGGTSFEDAVVLEERLYETTVRQGEPSVFAFPLTWGQHAQVLAAADPVEGSLLSIEPVWVTPLGGQLRAVEPSGSPVPRELPLAGGDAVWSTPIVTYRNRARPGSVGFAGGVLRGSSAAAPAAFAGTYFLLLEIPADADGTDFPDELTVRLGPTTVTDYEGRVPAYDGEPSPLSALDGSGFVATEEERRRAELAAREASAEPPPLGLVGGLFAGAALLAVVGGFAVGRLLRGRRS